MDDTLDAFSVHGVGGIFGAIITGVLASRLVNPAGADGLLFGNPSLLLIQLLAVAVTIVFSGTVTFVLLKLVDWTIGIRSGEAQESEGLDLVEHGEKAYHELI